MYSIDCWSVLSRGYHLRLSWLGQVGFVWYQSVMTGSNCSTWQRFQFLSRGFQFCLRKGENVSSLLSSESKFTFSAHNVALSHTVNDH